MNMQPRFPQPKIYVCLEGQFNYTLGLQLGYPYLSYFLAGWINGTKDASWKGISSDYKTMKEVKDALYSYNYSNIELEGYDIYPNLKNISSSTRYIFPHGYCLLLDQSISYDFTSVFTKRNLKGTLYN